MSMTQKQWMDLIGHDKLLKWITDLLLTVYQVDEETGLCKGKIVPDGPMQKDWQIWEDERLCVYFDRLDDDARMWVVTIIKETDQRIPMECKYDLLNQTFRFMEEGAERRTEDIWFAGFNTISFSFRKDGDQDAGCETSQEGLQEGQVQKKEQKEGTQTDKTADSEHGKDC